MATQNAGQCHLGSWQRAAIARLNLQSSSVLLQSIGAKHMAANPALEPTLASGLRRRAVPLPLRFSVAGQPVRWLRGRVAV